MRIIDKILQYLGFSDLIKIEGKTSFDDLTVYEVGLLIDSFLEDGNKYFDPLAFNDFLHANLNNDRLKKIQFDLNKNAFLKPRSEEWPPINTVYLIALSKALKSGNTDMVN